MLTLQKQKFKHCFKLDKMIFMEDTMLIQLTNKKAARLLHDMEDLKLIKVLQENIATPLKGKLSDKYKGIFTKEEGQQLNEHIQQMRSEWNSI
jgi:hypothetical protein